MANKYSFVDIPITQSQFSQSPEGRITLDILIKALNQDLPRSVQFLNIIQLTLKNLYSSQNILLLKLWSYEEIHEKDNPGFPIISERPDPTDPLLLVFSIISKDKAYNMIYCRDDPSPEQAIEFLKLFNWSKEQVFGTVNTRLAPFLQKVGKSQGGNAEVNPNWVLYLPKDKWGSISRPPPFGVKVHKLSKEHASVVNSHWKFAEEDKSLLLFQDAIEHFISAGVFLEKSNDTDLDDGTGHSSNELASWIASMPIGTFNALHTPENHRRNGYGDLCVREASRQAINVSIYPLCEVELGSLASKALLEKIGFQVAFDACWIFYHPPESLK